ncbi:hypothetical protein MNBD_GAMMA01-1378 [hydrothermal vent metagenome]|uniref:Uncharacterized protein n=1 Tax=hydrothermal vent metagenome TaxID=652676 RepID=A0A3B0VGA6_9ZZZZ
MADNKHIGSSLDDLFAETGDLAEVNAVAIKRVIAWELMQKMENEHISKTAMAKRLSTSRSSLDRLLDPTNTSITLHTLESAAMAVGKQVRIELV